MNHTSLRRRDIHAISKAEQTTQHMHLIVIKTRTGYGGVTENASGISMEVGQWWKIETPVAKFPFKEGAR